MTFESEIELYDGTDIVDEACGDNKIAVDGVFETLAYHFPHRRHSQLMELEPWRDAVLGIDVPHCAHLPKVPYRSGILENMNHTFRKFSQWISERMGSPWAFVIAVFVIAIWALSGPLFGYSEQWQLIVNTGTTILTFLMVFLIQNTQNRDARAIQLKLDELIRAIDPARNILIDIEDMEDSELALLQEEFKKFRAKKIAEIISKKNR